MRNNGKKWRDFIRGYGVIRFRWLRSKLRKLAMRGLDKSQSIELLPGLRIHLELKNDPKQYLSQDVVFWFYEEMEPALQWAIRNLIPLGGTMVDCGGNTGIMGFLAAYHRNAQVHIIEADPNLSMQIRESAALNPRLRCVTHAIGASDRNGELIFERNLSNDGGGRFVKEEDPVKGPRFPVPVKRLEDVLEEGRVEAVDFIKIDTEHHDHLVLLGMGKYLDTSLTKILYVEESNDPWIIDLLRGKGFVSYQAISMYIDDLRKNHDERVFFHRTEYPGANCLWCANGGEADKFLSRF